MQSNVGRVVLGIAVVAVAVVLLVVLRDSGDDDGGKTDTTAAQTTTTPSEEPAAPPIPTIVVKDGKPVGGVEELTYDAGERIRFKVTSNVGDEVHIHGYDVEKEIEAGGTVTFDFPASIEGLFEAELHGSEEQIAEIRVNP